MHQEPHRAGRRGLRPLGHPHLHVARTSGSDLPGAELGRCNGHLVKTYPALRRCEGIAGPIPGALGNRDLVVVTGVAPVNLAGLKSVGPDHPCTRSRGVPPMARDCQGWVGPGSPGSPRLADSLRGALAGSLLEPSVYGLSAIPDMTANPKAGWPVARVPPAVQGMNWNAQHFRDIRERHELVSCLECHDHLPSRDSWFRDRLLAPRVSAANWVKALGVRTSGSAGPLEQSQIGDCQKT